MLDNFKRAIKYSYAKKLLLLVSIITICIFIAFDIVVISLSNSYLTNQVVGQINTISKETSAVLDNFMTAKIQSLNQIAAPLPIRDFLTNVKSKNEIKSNSRYTAVNGILNSSLKIDEDFSSTWIVSDTGNFKYSSNYLVSSDDFNIKTQPWYSTLSTVTDEDYIWFSSVPTKSSNNNEPYFTIVTPVFENSNIVGYAGADVNFSNLTKMFEKFEFIDGTKTAIISNDGTGIYVKNDDNFFNTFTDEHDTISLSLRTYLRTGEKSYKLDSFNPNSNYVSFQKNNLTAWNVMVFCDGYSVFHDRNVLSLTIVLLTACAAALIIIFVYRRILLSISDVPKIIKVIDDVNNGIYTSKIGSASSDEFGQIANAIDNMSTDLQNRIEVIENYAYYDQLTELPNQNKMYEVLGEFITYAFDHSGKFALVFLDINNFKWINDTLGHNFGDEFLKVFSKCIKETLDEYGVVSRFSGDKFVLLIPFSGENEILSEYITKIQNKFQQPIVVCGDQIFVRFSVGVAVYPDDGANSELLLRNADIAMNISKENGYNVIEYYNNNLHKSVLNKALISQNLVNALDNGELFLNYQPILTTQNREIHGFEVLLRWTNDKLGSVPPSEFIPIAEETGAIIPIGTWIFESACRFHKALIEKFHMDLILSINVSPRQLLQNDYIDGIKRVLEITNIDPKLLQIEITENVLIDICGKASNVIQQLSDLGIKIALDDFGTGYSSMSYLKLFPISCLKIDKSFIDEIFNNKKDYAITDSIIELVHNLDIMTVAEGVETEGQFASLNNMNCDLIQGYLMSKPLSENSAIEFIENYKLLTEGI